MVCLVTAFSITGVCYGGDRVRIGNTGYNTLNAALDAAVDGDVVKIRNTGFVENVALKTGTVVTLKAGLTSDFSGVNGYSIVDGTLTVVAGMLTVDRLMMGTVPAAPVIVHEPEAATVTAGNSVVFAVQVYSTIQPTYQWMKNGMAIIGATSASYTLTAQQADNGALFSVIVSNLGGEKISQSAQLTVYPIAGNPDGHCVIPPDGALEDISITDQTVGSGTAASCNEDAFISAVAKGGVITFNCGAAPVTISITKPAKIYNNAKPRVVIDGGGMVTLDGGNQTRLIYMNTCDESLVWTTPHCDNQEFPQLTVQNLTFINGNSRADTEYTGGGAIWARGGRLKVINSRFFNNSCALLGPDVGGAAIRAFSQYNSLPVYVVNSVFGGAVGLGNYGANGGGISSIGVSWKIINSLFSYNYATGNGGNPAAYGTPGGGSGGAIYNDGLTMTLSLCGTLIESNSVNAHGSAIFFVSNNHNGTINITDSVIRNNSGGSWYVKPGISAHSDTVFVISNSTIQ